MSDSRDDPPTPASRPDLIASTTRLSPVQEAYGASTRHALGCSKCRDIDRDRCSTGDDLWNAYLEISAQAYRRLARETG